MSFLKGLIDKLDPKAQGTAVDPNAPPTPSVDVAGPRSDNTGIAGNIAPTLDQPVATPAAPKTYDLSRMTGYSADKMNDPNKQSAKYQIGRALNPLDARKGLDAQALAALNGLGFGTFSSNGADKLSLSGLTDKGRAAGLVGDYKDADFIAGFKGGDGKWTYADPAEEARVAALGGGGATGHAGAISPILAGQNSGLNIQDALSKFGQPSDLIQQLIAKLQGAA